MNWKNANIWVLGLGRSGCAAARLAQSVGAQVRGFDQSLEGRATATNVASLRREGIACGVDASEIEGSVPDLLVISPGIDPASDWVQSFRSGEVPLWGELEFAWHFCHKPVVAITGTNGKTTTTEMVVHLLNAQGRRCRAGGNYGEPFSELVRVECDQDLYVLEVSSFQLETVESFRPTVSCWLNFAPDHLDRYATVEDYRAAKWRLFAQQTADDFAVLNADEELASVAAQSVTFSAEGASADFSLRDGQVYFEAKPIFSLSSMPWRGRHNAQNAMAALAIGHCLQLEFDAMVAALRTYHTPAHRLEWVGSHGGVDYVNDSKATNLHALAHALEAFEVPIYLIAGGKEKGLDFATLQPLVAQKVKGAFLIGECAPRIEKCWSAETPCINCSSLEEAMRTASSEAEPGSVVLLSPGTSAYDMFANYEERGEHFRQIFQTQYHTTHSP